MHYVMVSCGLVNNLVLRGGKGKKRGAGALGAVEDRVLFKTPSVGQETGLRRSVLKGFVGSFRDGVH